MAFYFMPVFFHQKRYSTPKRPGLTNVEIRYVVMLKNRFYSLYFSFAIDKEEIRPHIENRDLKSVLKDKKLFIVDHRVLDGIKGHKNLEVRQSRFRKMCTFGYSTFC